MVNHHCCLQFGAAAAAATANGGFAPQYRRPVLWNAVIMLTMIKEIVTTIYGRRKGKERSGWHKKRHKFSHHLLYGHNVGRIKVFFFRLIHDSNSLSNLLFFFLLLFNTFDLQRWKTSVQFKKFLPKWLRVSCTRHGWWCGKTDVFAQSLPHAVNHDCASVITDG